MACSWPTGRDLTALPTNGFTITSHVGRELRPGRTNGRLFDDAQHMLDAFLADAVVHYSVVEAIARGERTWSRITSRVGRDGGSLLRPVQWLQDMNIVRRVTPVTEAGARVSKRALYEIADPYITFWHRFVAPLIGSGSAESTDGALLWRKMIAPRVDDGNHFTKPWLRAECDSDRG